MGDQGGGGGGGGGEEGRGIEAGRIEAGGGGGGAEGSGDGELVSPFSELETGSAVLLNLFCNLEIARCNFGTLNVHSNFEVAHLISDCVVHACAFLNPWHVLI